MLLLWGEEAGEQGRLIVEEELLKGGWVAVLLLKWERGLEEEKLVLDVAGVCIRKLAEAEAGEGGAGEVDGQEEEEGGE